MQKLHGWQQIPSTSDYYSFMGGITSSLIIITVLYHRQLLALRGEQSGMIVLVRLLLLEILIKMDEQILLLVFLVKKWIKIVMMAV